MRTILPHTTSFSEDPFFTAYTFYEHLLSKNNRGTIAQHYKSCTNRRRLHRYGTSHAAGAFTSAFERVQTLPLNLTDARTEGLTNFSLIFGIESTPITVYSFVCGHRKGALCVIQRITSHLHTFSIS